MLSESLVPEDPLPDVDVLVAGRGALNAGGGLGSRQPGWLRGINCLTFLLSASMTALASGTYPLSVLV